MASKCVKSGDNKGWVGRDGLGWPEWLGVVEESYCFWLLVLSCRKQSNKSGGVELCILLQQRLVIVTFII